MPIRCESFLLNFSTWGINVSSWLISSPKSFAQRTFSSCFPLTTTARSWLILVESRLPVMISTFVLPSLRGSLLTVAHWSTSEIVVVNELCRTPTESKLAAEVNVVSSAYRSIWAELTCSGRSLIKAMKSKGPRIEPWGTPWRTQAVGDSMLPIDTNWRLSFRYDRNQINDLLSSPYAWSFYNRIEGSTMFSRTTIHHFHNMSNTFTKDNLMSFICSVVSHFS